MKVKSDFVTNSSSTSFIISVPKKVLRKDIEKKIRFYYGESFRYFDSLKNLITYTQGEQCDWVTLARGYPKRFAFVTESSFNCGREILESGNSFVRVIIDRNNWDRVYKFIDIIENDFQGNIKYQHGG